MPLEDKGSSPAVSDSALRLQGEPPPFPADVLERFPSLGTWADSNNRFWKANAGALQDFARAILDVTEIAGVLTVDPNNQSLYIRRVRGAGFWGDPDSAFYVDKTPGYFSLGSNLTWNPIEKELIVDGTIYASAGEIGGFIIGTDNIRDTANSFGLSSVVTAGDDVRFWAGDTFANRATAPFRVYESGAIVATSGTIGGFSLGTDYIRDAANSMGLASTVSGGDDVRFWAGATFANRATAPFFVTEAGALTATNATISGTITSSVVIVGYTAQYTDSTTSAFQVINTSGQANLIQNFCFGGGTPNFEGWVAGGTITVPTQALSGRLMKLKLVTYGSGGGGWINGGNASIWLVTTEDQTLTARGTEIRFRTTANGTITEGYGLVIGNDGRLYIGPDNALARDTNLYRNAANELKTDDALVVALTTNLQGAVDCDSTLNVDFAVTFGTTLNVTGAVTAASFSGIGTLVTALTADNVTAGTLANARLPAAISVTSLTASGEIRGATARFGTFTGTADAPVNGWIDVTDAGGNARKLATVA